MRRHGRHTNNQYPLTRSSQAAKLSFRHVGRKRPRNTVVRCMAWTHDDVATQWLFQKNCSQLLQQYVVAMAEHREKIFPMHRSLHGIASDACYLWLAAKLYSRTPRRTWYRSLVVLVVWPAREEAGCLPSAKTQGRKGRSSKCAQTTD